MNQIWNDPEGDGTYCNFPVCQGLAWGVTGNSLPLNPGDLLVLRVDDSYPKINWPLNAGDVVYAQVDSWNPETNYGTVIETHEAYGGPYDNIRWATRVLYRLSEGAGHAAIAGQGVSFDDLPARP
ncbi:MAG: hypothetical protein H5T70_06930 [Chloroflexi bacterium]|nr:hypothetical protein [Chloroflexota bacterium]